MTNNNLPGLVTIDKEKIEDDLDPRLMAFIDCYLSKDSDTFGNATKSAIKAYNLEIPRQYNYARKLGSVLVTKSNIVVREYLESQGITLPRMLDIAVAKMIKNKNPEWWAILMEMSGYKKVTPVLNQTNYQQNNYFGTTKEDREKLNEEFEDFLDSKYAKSKTDSKPNSA